MSASEVLVIKEMLLRDYSKESTDFSPDDDGNCFSPNESTYYNIRTSAQTRVAFNCSIQPGHHDASSALHQEPFSSPKKVDSSVPNTALYHLQFQATSEIQEIIKVRRRYWRRM